MKNDHLVGMMKIAMCVALLCVSAYLSFPLPFTPIVITAQTIIVNLLALILTPRQAVTAVAVYLLMGTVGLPVFSGGGSGLAKLLGPTGGFLFGFLFMVLAISLLKGKNNHLGRYLLVTIGVGMPVLYFMGTAYMCLTAHLSVPAALMAAVVPFLAGDVLKCVGASLLAVALNKVFSLQRQPC